MKKSTSSQLVWPSPHTWYALVFTALAIAGVQVFLVASDRQALTPSRTVIFLSALLALGGVAIVEAWRDHRHLLAKVKEKRRAR